MTSHWRLLIYILPVTLLSFTLNIQKFVELTLTQVRGKDHENNITEGIKIVFHDVFKIIAELALVKTVPYSQHK